MIISSRLRTGGLDIAPSSGGMNRWRRFRARFDWPLLILVLLISTLGLFNLYSATHGTRHAAKFDQQVVRMAIGAVLYFAMTFLDYRAMVRIAGIFMIVTIAALVIVAFLGPEAVAKGSQRWLALGPVRLQPCELAKIAVILTMAKLIQDHSAAPLPYSQIIARVAVIGLPVLLIGKQPDLGSAVLVVLIALSIGFLCVNKVWPVAAITVTGMAMIPILWETMKDYQKLRVLAFLDPSADPTGSGWHTRQSIYAVGSGRLTGKGFMEGTQNQFDFLPEHWTDFPFSVWAEEWGFLGSFFLIVLFAVLIFWTINVALVARDRAGSVICAGTAAMLFWHFVVNIAMVLGMAPVVGVTLPFVSYGGSSLIAFFLALGMVSSVSLRRHGF